MAETLAHTPLFVAVPPATVVAENLPGGIGEEYFRKQRITKLARLYQKANGDAFFVETMPVADEDSTSIQTTVLAPVTLEQCARGAAVAREVSDELGWDARWEISDGIILARYENAQRDLVARSSFDFFTRMSARLGVPMLQVLSFDVDTGAE